MNVFELKDTFGLEGIRAGERAKPVPGPGEVLVRIKAVSLNARDLGVVGGFYVGAEALPLIPVSDGAGVVEGLGEGVTRVKPGDRVCPIFVQEWVSGTPSRQMLGSTLGGPRDGVLAEYAVFPQEALVLVPEYLTDEEAAALPIAGLTAWHALVTEGRIRAGETVVIQGTGGVALFALQFAKLHGARVIITSGSDAKLERAATLGADFGINYKTHPKWEQEVLRLTGGIGADHVLDLGGAATLNAALAAVRPGGRVSIIGVLSGTTAEGVDLIAAIQKKVTLQGVNVGSREMFEDMNRALRASRIRPVIDRVFPFAESVEALRYLQQGAHFGKICIRL
ncbi:MULTISPECIES: zinc-dependent alcohol dehydrogenase family protein [Paenibacillus]|uniref:zinc-dependent alcohol dehydrogenase family protein n=1 Tax=Paenibacillus TaxID=44249 RepID=UPI0022B930FC|nr:NAD(P)-dependent alcohol dehydrogenase [Paenibacillus caseinilyticus]MCZ8521556.1 NAD(P)-dependent alcohol dehydrogenase [Paenibacillus caseinilyticus]